MAGNLSDYAEAQVVKWLFSTDSITRPTSWYAALYTTSPDDTGGGVEVSTGGYARQAVTFTDAGSGVYANNAQISFDAVGADFGTVVAIGVLDAVSAGNLLAWKVVASQSVVNGQSARFASGALTVRFD
jgi:hypothetical protein